MLNVKTDPDQTITSTTSPENNMAAIASNGTAANGGRAIVHVDPSAAGEGLDELFKAVINGNQHQMTQQVLPMRQRRLPPSFFRPPSAASSTNSVNHSRESSLDGGYQSTGNTGVSPLTPTGGALNGSKSPFGGTTHNGLQIIHPRANSSPAELQRPVVNGNGVGAQSSVSTFSSTDLGKSSVAPATNGVPAGPAPGNGPTHHGSHIRTMSYDLDSIRLPDNWEMSFTPTGERYFLNHKDKTTTWEDPRKVVFEEMIRRSTGNLLSPTTTQPPPLIIQHSSPAHHLHLQQQQIEQSQQEAQLQLGLASGHIDPCTVPLPEGWEQARTATGDVYFISHLDQTTSWFHPAIPRNLQMKRVQAHQQQAHTAQPPPFNVNLSNIAAAVAMGANSAGANIPPELVAALKNMNCQTTTNSILGVQADQSSALFSHKISHSSSSSSSSSNGTPTPSSSQQQQHLRDLELERERMRQRQEELLQNNLLTANASNLLLSSTAAQLNNNHNEGNSFMSTSALGLGSPFASLRTNECHSRQESADSGLDLGNSSNYSMPHTPDDFLRTVSNGTGAGVGLSSVASNNGNSILGGGSSLSGLGNDLPFEGMQLAGLDDLPDESMDFMQVLETEMDLSPDLLSNMEEILNVNKDNIDNMTWDL